MFGPSSQDGALKIFSVLVLRLNRFTEWGCNMKMSKNITGENFDHKIAAIFESENSANQAADTVRNITSLKSAQVFVVAPNDTHKGWELEPEDRGIWRTMIRAHVRLGLVGMALGFVLFLVLFMAGIQFIVANAIISAALGLAFGGIAGLMLGGLVTLRPDHMPYVSVSQSALKRGKFVVAVHAANVDQLKEADREFNKLGATTVRSF